MKVEYIKSLINSFYEGNITPMEEQELYEYFTQENIDKDLIREKNIFLSIFNLREESIPIPDGLNIKLENLIDEMSEKGKKKYPLWKWVGGIAASLIILLGIGLYVQNTTIYNNPLTDTYSDPHDAYKETQRALLLMASQMNKGLAKLEKAENDLAKKREFVNNKINKK